MSGVPFGRLEPLTQERLMEAAEEVQRFVEWIDALDVDPEGRRVLRTLLDMATRADARELVTGRCAVRSYPAEVARRSLVRDDIAAVLQSLVEAGHITMFPESKLGSSGPGVIFRVRRPDVVLCRAAGANLWPEDTRAYRRHKVRRSW